MQLLHHHIGSAHAELTCYLLDNSPLIDENRIRPCVVVIPGGGYLENSDREAEPIAIRMLSYGYQACVLHYSTAPTRYPTALCELAEAITLIRSHAEQWHIDPQAIFVAGFSAGGHLAANLGIAWNSELLANLGFNASTIRPNGLLLGYAVLTAGEYAHQPSIERLLGEQADNPEARACVSIENNITADFPPTFLFHTMTDMTVPVENSLLVLSALRRAHVPVEAHFFPTGRHGISLGTPETSYTDGSGVEQCVQIWPDLFRTWVDQRTHFLQS